MIIHTMQRIILLFTLSLCLYPSCYAQDDDIRQRWSDCKKAIEDGKVRQIKQDLLYVYRHMERPLCAFYIGLCYESEEQIDSALYYYSACIDNSRKPQKRALQYKIDLLMRMNAYDQAFDLCVNQLKGNGYSPVFLHQLEKITLGYFLVQTKFLDQNLIKSYHIQKEYPASCIIEQQLIVGQLRDSLGRSARILRRSFKDDHQVWELYFSSKTDMQSIHFLSSMDESEKRLDQLHTNAKQYFNDETNPLIGRLGALYSLLPLSEKNLIDLLENKDNLIRLCTCLQYKSTMSKKLKKKCMQENQDWIIYILEQQKAYQG